jgi:serine/threonine-protein kinase HSL1, negative regulator of Swe1 kinase
MLHRPNHEKLFYRALVKFREEQLENYPGSTLEYSASDYHHVTKPPPKPVAKRGANLQVRNHNRRRSQFSIISEDSSKRDSYYKDPATSASTTTKGSYDPYRSSRSPVVENATDQPIVVVRQGSAGSRVRNVSHAGGLKHPALSRLRTDQLTSLPSQELEKILCQKKHSYTPGASRSSLSSSRRANSDAGIRKSASYRRHVSFQHHRHGSSGTGGTRSKLSAHQRLISFEADSAEPLTITSEGMMESRSTPSVLTPSHIAQPLKPASELDMRKSRVASHYWKDEARKVSTELGKICEEAFNRSSVSSSTMSQNRPAESPTTSVSTQGETAAIRLNNQLKNRPLPQPPAESLGSYTLRELTDIRCRLLDHCQNERSDTIPTYVKNTITHLDQLIDADRHGNTDKRSASDPNPVSSRGPSRVTAYPAHLDGAEFFRSREPTTLAHDMQALRAASDPMKSNNKVTFEDATIRLVSPDPLSPLLPIQPLNIRKNKAGLSANALPNGSSETLRSVFEHGGHESRFYGPGALDTIEEDPVFPQKWAVSGSPGGNRKWSWFKRSPGPGADAPPLPSAKNSPIKSDGNELEKSVSQGSSNLSKARSLTIDGDELEVAVEKKRNWFQKMFARVRAKEQIKPDHNDHEIVNDLSETESDPGGSETLLTDNTDAKAKKLVKNYNPSRTAVGTASDERPIHISQNWFAKFFHVKPATKLITLSVTKARARKEIVKVLKEWRKYGLRDVISEKHTGSGDVIRGRVDDVNCEYFAYRCGNFANGKFRSPSEASTLSRSSLHCIRTWPQMQSQHRTIHSGKRCRKQLLQGCRHARGGISGA